MRELDKTKVYDLSELTSEELKELWKCLVKTDSDWEDCGLEELIAYQKTYRLFFNEHNWEWCNISEPTTNAKELFYTLENIQVYCRELSEEQIKEMADVFEKDGISVDRKYLDPIKGFNKTFLMFVNGDVFMTQETEEKTTITYDKFMELFAIKPLQIPNLNVAVESGSKFAKELKESGFLTQPHYNNTNGSIYKFCNDQKLNSWEFDIIKRVVRCRKKGLFKEDLQKTKDLIDLYLKEWE